VKWWQKCVLISQWYQGLDLEELLSAASACSPHAYLLNIDWFPKRATQNIFFPCFGKHFEKSLAADMHSQLRCTVCDIISENCLTKIYYIIILLIQLFAVYFECDSNNFRNTDAAYKSNFEGCCDDFPFFLLRLDRSNQSVVIRG